MSEKRRRATREEMIARTQAKLEKLLAQKEGIFSDDGDTIAFKLIRKALRRRKTLLHRADILLNGRPATEKSPAQNGIEEKIRNAEARLNDLRESKRRAEERIAKLPFDIAKLKATIDEAEKNGTEPVFPSDEMLCTLEVDPTETEIEANATED